MTLRDLWGRWRVWVGILIGVAVVALAEVDGLWWMTLVCGGLLGLLVGGWQASVGGSLIGVLGWGIPLLWETRTEPVAAVTGVLGGMPGVVALAATLLAGMLLALAGAWVGIAVRALLRRPGEPPPSSTSGESGS